ncbi:MAG: S-methyl-5-thioribose-1-phosphate isomerase [Candidatus Aenigmarchaeota archaeon]|nr:S-methyl-5-thioribose-1-phosphate isomerase [Candidatus Aenigmarchaeota archaeon]
MLVGGKNCKSVWYDNHAVHVIDQKKLPFDFQTPYTDSYATVAGWIRDMTVRGAPAIGAAGAFGMALAAIEAEKNKRPSELEIARDRLIASRPTAVDLRNCVERVFNKASIDSSAAVNEAVKISEEIVRECKKIAEHGEKLVKNGYRIATHCNTGWLAAVDWGTAEGVIFMANRNGKSPFVFVGETRPRNQGSRLTAWELTNEKVDHAIIADSALAHYMQAGEVDMMVVGADRILLNGDTVNKIGTLEKAIIAKEFGVPFYVAAPMTTFDRVNGDRKKVTIEERSGDEVLYQEGVDENNEIRRIRTASPGSKALNPSFDFTSAKYITAIITPKGIIKPEKSEIMKILKTY